MNDMGDYVSELLAAERRGRALALSRQPTARDEWKVILGHGPDACAFMTAARWAKRLGAAVDIHLPENEDPSQVWRDLLDSSVRQRIVRTNTRHSRGESSSLIITRGGEQLEINSAPENTLAWRTSLANAAPVVLPVTAESPRLTTRECRAIDTCAIEEFHVPSLCLMENAAIGAASVARHVFPNPHSVLVLAGGGNNGGDGLALARGLDTLGIPVHVALFKNPEDLRGDALVNYHQLLNCQSVAIHYLAEQLGDINDLLRRHAVIIDALMGTGFSGVLSSSFVHIITKVNESRAPVLALDIPSGLNSETGDAGETAMICRATVTFAAVKPGIESPKAIKYVGECYLADIGAPSECFSMGNL